MLKIYNAYSYVSIDGGEWREVGDRGYRISNEKLGEKLLIDNLSFEEVRKYILGHHVNGVWNDETIFRKKPVINIAYTHAWDSVRYKKFQTLSYKVEYVEWDTVTFEWLQKHLSADQCLQYLKEHGVIACPILNGGIN